MRGLYKGDNVKRGFRISDISPSGSTERGREGKEISGSIHGTKQTHEDLRYPAV